MPALPVSNGPTVTLTGEAIYGLTSGTVADYQHRALLEQLPQTVRLGRLTPKARPQTLRLEAFVDLVKTVPKPSVDWYTKARESITRMYLNDRYGCCVFSGKAHNLGVWSANDPDSAEGKTVLCTDQEISDQYFAYTGGRDDGAVIFQVLDYMVSKGFLASGKRYKLSGYVSADWRSKELTQVGIDLFGGGCIGVMLPQAWSSDAVWDVTNTRIVGGHDVSPVGYGANVLGTTADGVVVSSWGRLYLITWRAWTSTNWLDELFFCVPEFLWTGLDQRAPSGVDFGKLKEALKMIGGGTIPPLPDPIPPVPPVPPTPPVPPVPPIPPIPPVPPVPPIPPTPTPIVSTGTTKATQIQVPTGIFGRYVTVTIPPLPVTVTSVPSPTEPLGEFQELHDRLLNELRATHATAPNWQAIAFDVLALVLAIRSRDSAAIIAALSKLAADLGLPPLSHLSHQMIPPPLLY